MEAIHDEASKNNGVMHIRISMICAVDVNKLTQLGVNDVFDYLPLEVLYFDCKINGMLKSESVAKTPHLCWKEEHQNLQRVLSVFTCNIGLCMDSHIVP
jgi:hypothetical protein